MSIVKSALTQVENRLPKVVDARVHGFIDYSHAAFFLSMAMVCRKQNPRAALAALVTGSFVLVQSLLTDYPLGAASVIPFQLHGRMDAGFAAGSFAIPKIFGFEGTKASVVFKTNAFVEPVRAPGHQSFCWIVLWMRFSLAANRSFFYLCASAAVWFAVQSDREWIPAVKM